MSDFVFFIFSTLIVFGFLLLCREITCWYFKLSKIVEQLDQLNAQMAEFLKRLEVK